MFPLTPFASPPEPPVPIRLNVPETEIPPAMSLAAGGLERRIAGDDRVGQRRWALEVQQTAASLRPARVRR